METIKAALYLTYLDRLLSGEAIETVENDEIAGLVRLSQLLLAADFSGESKIRERLLHRVLGSLPPGQAGLAVSRSDAGTETELTEEELTLVTAAGQETAHSCSRCGASLGWLQRQCPFCRE